MKTYVKNFFGRLTIKILIVEPGRRLSDQRHARRSEFWYVMAGTAAIELEGQGNAPQTIMLESGNVIVVPRGTWHRLGCVASSARPVKILEISIGAFDEEDIERRADDYGRK